MKVEMLVRVDVVEPQASRGETRKLCGDLCTELQPNGGAEENVYAGARHIGPEMAPAIDKVGNLFRRQRWCPLNQYKVQPDTKTRQPPRARNRVVKRRARHHQAGGGQAPSEMPMLNRFINLYCRAKIIGGDNQRFHWLPPLALIRPSFVTSSLSPRQSTDRTK